MKRERMVCFGTGKIGEIAYYAYKNEKDIVAYIDNNTAKQGSMFHGIPIISLDHYLNHYSDIKLVLTCGLVVLKQIKTQLEEAGISDYSLYEDKRETLVSFSNPHDREDLILYHALRNEDDIFYIDVGSNDPTLHSVTKLLYDNRGGHGINIDPIRELIDKTNIQRTRDINICAGVADTSGGDLELYVQGGGFEGSTFDSKNAVDEKTIKTRTVPKMTLKEICDNHIKPEQNITFLKIDVEGFEKEVLLGADFGKYRPFIIVMESTEPNTMVFNHAQWEDILTNNRYHFAFTHGVNRYYVADERADMDHLFAPIDDILHLYNVYEINAAVND